MDLHDINVDTLGSTLTRRGRHQRDRLVTLRCPNTTIFRSMFEVHHLVHAILDFLVQDSIRPMQCM